VVAWDDRDELDSIEVEGVVRAGGALDAALAEHPIDEHTYVVMVTRNVDLDAGILPLLLASPAAHIGLMGSTRRWATTRERLENEGMGAELLDRVESPIGKEIAAETPAEIAVSILARVIEHERTR
jgi:xanthine dehydrogenase accessory factor